MEYVRVLLIDACFMHKCEGVGVEYKVPKFSCHLNPNKIYIEKEII